MKILIFSDSHGDLKLLDETIAKYANVSYIIHCGDYECKDVELKNRNILAVRGNNDISLFPNLEQIDLGTNKLVFTHGHLYDVNYGLMKLNYLAKELDANIVCFGHTHEVLVTQEDNIIFINPGAFYMPRTNYGKTYGLLEIDETIKVSIFNEQHERVKTHEYSSNSSK